VCVCVEALQVGHSRSDTQQRLEFPRSYDSKLTYVTSSYFSFCSNFKNWSHVWGIISVAISASVRFTKDTSKQLWLMSGSRVTYSSNEVEAEVFWYSKEGIIVKTNYSDVTYKPLRSSTFHSYNFICVQWIFKQISLKSFNDADKL